MKRHGCAKVVTTDGLRSYGAAVKALNIADRQEVGRWANNRVENSHQPFRRRERAMLRFRRMKTLGTVRSLSSCYVVPPHKRDARRPRLSLVFLKIAACCPKTRSAAGRSLTRTVCADNAPDRSTLAKPRRSRRALRHVVTDEIQG